MAARAFHPPFYSMMAKREVRQFQELGATMCKSHNPLSRRVSDWVGLLNDGSNEGYDVLEPAIASRYVDRLWFEIDGDRAAVRQHRVQSRIFANHPDDDDGV